MTDVLIFLADEVPRRVDDDKGNWEQVYFTVPLDQFERQLPADYARFVAKELTHIRCMVTHADEYGNIRMTNLLAARAYKPDLLFTCHSKESRRVNPEFNIQGFNEGKTWIAQYGVKGNQSRIVKIEKE